MTRPGFWLRLKRLYLGLGLAYTALLLYVCLSPLPPQPIPAFEGLDKLEHIVSFFVLMLWFGQLWQGRTARMRLALACWALGGIIELLQGAMALGRSMEFLDFVADGVGVLLAFWLIRGRAGGLLQALENRLFGARNSEKLS